MSGEPTRPRLLGAIVQGWIVDGNRAGLSPLAAVALAEVAIDALIDAAFLVTADRFDEDCHACDRLIRDHRVDGRCPVEDEDAV